MVTTQSLKVHCAADTLLQLANIVEGTGMTPGEFGHYLNGVMSDRGESLNRQGQADLLELCQCATSSSEFANGLRRQAELMRQRLAD